MRTGTIAVGGVCALFVASLIVAGLVQHAERRAVSELETRVSALPEGFRLSYLRARYSLWRDEWNLEGITLAVPDQPYRMAIADLTVRHLDRAVLEALLDPSLPVSGQPLMGDIRLSNWTIEGDGRNASFTHVAATQPVFRMTPSTDDLFDPRRWVAGLEAESIRLLGVYWREDGSERYQGRIDRLDALKLVSETKEGSTENGAEGTGSTERVPSVESLRLSDAVLSWNGKGGARGGARLSFRLSAHDFFVEDGTIRSFLALNDPHAIGEGPHAVTSWLRSLEGRRVGGRNLAFATREGEGWPLIFSSAPDNAEADDALEKDVFSIGELLAEGALGDGRFSLLRLDTVLFRRDERVAALLSLLSGPEGRELYDPDLRSFSSRRLEGRSVALGAFPFGLGAGSLTAEKNALVVSMGHDSERNKDLTAGIDRIALEEIVAQGDRPLSGAIRMEGVSLIPPPCRECADWRKKASVLAGGALTADAALRYAFDHEEKALDVLSFELAVEPWGTLDLSGRFVEIDTDGDFAPPVMARKFLENFMPETWAGFVARTAGVERLDLTYRTDRLGRTTRARLVLPGEGALERQWNAFIEAPQEKTLEVGLHPPVPVSVSSVLGSVGFLPLDRVREELGLSIRVKD